jgi:hypothetical protein
MFDFPARGGREQNHFSWRQAITVCYYALIDNTSGEIEKNDVAARSRGYFILFHDNDYPP